MINSVPIANEQQDLKALKRKPVSILSPLRYPGSKRRLAHYIGNVLELNQVRPQLFIEPFAGGASVSLQLLNDGRVESIGLNDRDPLVADFWKTAFFDSAWLIETVANIDVSLETWSAFKSGVQKSRRDRAIACLFLNRTSFSGILADRAGPIGGKQQKSKFPLGCRFPKETLIDRIRQLESLNHRVAFVWNKGWRETLSLTERMIQRRSIPEKKDIALYLDPPFFEKAERLYNYYFDNKNHVELRDYLADTDFDWILSYDSVDRVRELYQADIFNTANVELLYSTASDAGRRPAQEVVLSNFRLLPDNVKTWTANKRL